MCGRYQLNRTPRDVARHFGAELDPADAQLFGDLPPRFNIAPTQRILVVRSTGDTRTLD